jgi:DNA-3-methyladenine glycosylase II
MKMNLNKFRNTISEGKKYLSGNDLVLKDIIKRVGEFRIKPHKNYFETLVDSIVSQQLSIKAAETIFNRFKALFPLNENGSFPKPEEIIIMDSAKIRECGLSNPKVSYVKDLCTKVLDDTIKIHILHKLSDEEIINELVKVKGIGIWTAHMFLMFCLARLNVLPVGDLGLKRAVMINYKLRKFPDENKVAQISKKNNWAPYNTIASWYLWQSLN